MRIPLSPFARPNCCGSAHHSSASFSLSPQASPCKELLKGYIILYFVNQNIPIIKSQYGLGKKDCLRKFLETSVLTFRLPQAYFFSSGNVNYCFANVRGVVGDSFEVTRHQKVTHHTLTLRTHFGKLVQIGEVKFVHFFFGVS